MPPTDRDSRTIAGGLAASPPGPARLWPLSLAAAGLGLSVFVALGITLDRYRPFAADAAVRHFWLGVARPAVVLEACGKISFLGSNVRMAWLGWFAALLFLARRRLGAASTLALATFAAGAAYPRTKALLGRVRPEGARLLGETTAAFPSGHATAATAVLGAAAWLLWREGRVTGPTALVLGIAAPLSIGLSRVCLEAHWLTDVVGGWALGLAVAAASVSVYELLRPLGARPAIRTPE